ncbi:MAG: sulfite exporter TauE/SafE family protein [Candidatus Diapherotrites archaeon]|nr:sulfite exporter TauE/SafE family protein [Candidatus Diapherotrites archaeon]
MGGTVESARLKVFLNTVFFVLGFSVVFSLLGVLLNSVFSSVSFDLRIWISRIGGVIIILFGLYLLGLLKISFLEREHKLRAKKFSISYVTSFVFGATFAAGWSPCVGAILGAILTLAALNPASAFTLLLAYSFGLGVPFLLAGFFISNSFDFIRKFSPHLKYFNILSGAILVVLGVLVFTDRLSQIANFFFAQGFLGLDVAANLGGDPTIPLSFFAGILSFFSPCILPLVPAFLSYISGVSFEELKKK